MNRSEEVESVDGQTLWWLCSITKVPGRTNTVARVMKLGRVLGKAWVRIQAPAHTVPWRIINPLGAIDWHAATCYLSTLEKVKLFSVAR